MDECQSALTNTCDKLHGICINTDGSYECRCQDGFTLNEAEQCEGNLGPARLAPNPKLVLDY